MYSLRILQAIPGTRGVNESWSFHKSLEEALTYGRALSADGLVLVDLYIEDRYVERVA